MRFILVNMMIVCAGLAAGCEKQSPQSGPSATMKSPGASPEDKGIARAKADIANGKMKILYYGQPWSQGKRLVDEASGLPVEIVAGCCVTAEFVQETNAYNKTMRETLQDARLRAKAFLEKKGMDWGEPTSFDCSNGRCFFKYPTSDIDTTLVGSRTLIVPLLGGEPEILPGE
ncbi:MAG: hypothetical protein HZA50_03020 [Planctomycetes bacterium]|nr:hypothetical protein [Planctomycetota bacterium]